MDELNWLQIGITALLSSIGAFLGVYLSFVKKKEKDLSRNLKSKKESSKN